MRVVLLALLIAMLPLRSWAGDAMAIQMATAPGLTATVGVSASESTHVDCLERTEMGSDSTPQDQATDAIGHCNTCSACQACSAVAYVIPETTLALVPLPHSVPSCSAAHFTSADRALGQKPPIA